MPGVPGRGGPVPKRAADRRRRNKVDITQVDVAGKVESPPADEAWHELARQWYESLARSGQAQHYEPSDWAAARYVAEVMTRNLEVGRFSAQLFAAVWSAMGDLLTTEGERRRAKLEVNRTMTAKPAADGTTVARLDDYRAL